MAVQISQMKTTILWWIIMWVKNGFFAVNMRGFWALPHISHTNTNFFESSPCLPMICDNRLSLCLNILVSPIFSQSEHLNWTFFFLSFFDGGLSDDSFSVVSGFSTLTVSNFLSTVFFFFNWINWIKDLSSSLSTKGSVPFWKRQKTNNLRLSCGQFKIIWNQRNFPS